MKVSRRCPRCRGSFYHFVNRPKPDLYPDVPVHEWPPEDIPTKVYNHCADCGHDWRGRLTRCERGIED